MTTDLYSREQKLRKQAELQSLQVNLVTLRKQEVSYIAAAAAVPEFLANQIQEARREVRKVERELLTLRAETATIPGREIYWEGFEAELARDFERALKLYRQAAHDNYPDAEIAAQSVRHVIKGVKGKPAEIWIPRLARQPRQSFLWVGLIIIILLAIIILGYSNIGFNRAPTAVAVEMPTITLTFTPVTVIQIIPDTATPLPTAIPTETPTETPTATPIEVSSVAEASTEVAPTNTPTIAPTLRPAPRIIGPKDGLTWGDGAIVFEFEPYPALVNDELYCLRSLKGFDRTNTENWSYPRIGKHQPAIAIEPNVFRVARDQEIQCILWQAGIGKNSCDNLVSETTETRIIVISGRCQREKLKF